MKEIAKATMWCAAIWLALVPWLAVIAIVGHVRAQEADDVDALSRQVIQFYQEGKHAEAVPIAERALALAERLHSADHAEVGSTLHNLADNADALSGLARAFLYAGTRALLVSHWAVYSDTTVALITKALSMMAANTSVGRAEALRRSILTLIETGAPHEAHPAHWAPFVVVGEGATTR
jgi:CHAT domain/Tetratricopeptide repeat